MRLLFAWLLALLCYTSSAQTFSPKIVKRSLRADGDSAFHINVTEYNQYGTVTLPLLVRTPALQFTFTQIQHTDSGWALSTPIYLGYSYLWTTANGLLYRDSSMTVENRVFGGFGFNIGITPNSRKVLTGSIPIGAIIGYSRYGLFAGIDAYNGKPLFGISINMINFPLMQGLTKFNVLSEF